MKSCGSVSSMCYQGESSEDLGQPHPHGLVIGSPCELCPGLASLLVFSCPQQLFPIDGIPSTLISVLWLRLHPQLTHIDAIAVS